MTNGSTRANGRSIINWKAISSIFGILIAVGTWVWFAATSSAQIDSNSKQNEIQTASINQNAKDVADIKKDVQYIKEDVGEAKGDLSDVKATANEIRLELGEQKILLQSVLQAVE